MSTEEQEAALKAAFAEAHQMGWQACSGVYWTAEEAEQAWQASTLRGLREAKEPDCPLCRVNSRRKGKR